MKLFGFLRRMRLSEAAEAVAYKDGLLLVAPATLAGYRTSVNSFIRAVGNDPYLHELEPSMFHTFDIWMEENVGRVTANSRKRELRSVLNKAVSRGWLDASFSEHIRQKPEPPLAVKAISEEHYRLMVEHASLKWRAVIHTFWHTGCRSGGLRSMRVDSFATFRDGDAWAGSVDVVEKGNRPRTVFMKHDAVAAITMFLRSEHNGSEFLFPGKNGQQMYKTVPSNMLARIGKRAGVPKDAPHKAHAFRHAFAIRHLENKVPPDLVAQWMGIRVQTLLSRYTIRDVNKLRAAYLQFAETGTRK